MQIPLLIANAAEDLGHSHSVWDALPHLGGMVMVILTLFLLWGITAAVARLVSIFNAGTTAAPLAAAAAPPPTTRDTSEVPVAAIAAAVAASIGAEHPHGSVPPEIAAVIAAAVASMSGGSRRVISIKPMDLSWEKAGRQAVLYSHRIR
jgi:Na+-transporting methylmalonyl-CoA/oxaloacetate decarboxylase gamma subunit